MTHRLNYNLGILGASMIAVALYILLIWALVGGGGA